MQIATPAKHRDRKGTFASQQRVHNKIINYSTERTTAPSLSGVRLQRSNECHVAISNEKISIVIYHCSVLRSSWLKADSTLLLKLLLIANRSNNN
ncbi:hypothetical protein E2C01_029515 [Portunus trituberculatus]|uniref:Uncharacterized protein n=1 Tax=Portunus trituberculatus TaxID=210409 RepID=A0A5B7ES18_PORTR|nr:hypothetical protein [Portunus trituberculatus]